MQSLATYARAWLGGLCLLLQAVSGHAADKTATVTILHTNDIHGHLTAWEGWQDDLVGKNVGGLDRIAAEVGKVRKEVGVDKVLLLDAGDTLGDTLIAAKTQGRALIDAMNSMRYDAMVIGNHEVDFTAETLRTRMAEAKSPLLAANMLDKSSAELFANPYVIKEVGGIKIGILGLAYPNTAYTTAKKNVDGVRFVEAEKTAARYVPRMRREGAEIVIALTHLGLGADKQLAEHVADIDVIVGGHSHNRMRVALHIGPTLIVQAGAHGSDLGRLDLVIERDGKRAKVVRHQRALIALINETDRDMTKQIAAQIAPYRSKMDTKIGRAKTALIRAQTLAGDQPRTRDEESPADDLFADAVREATSTEAVFLPGVGYGVAIQPGDITAEQLKNLVPHESEIVTMSLTGRQIKSILEQSIENFSNDDASQKVGGMIQVSGVKFSYSPQHRKGRRVQDVMIGDKTLAMSSLYRVATNSLLADGGHKYIDFKRGRNQQKIGSQYEMIANWIRQRDSVSAPATGRTTKLAEQPVGK